MSQSTTFEFQASRSTALLNRQLLNVAPSGIQQGFNVVIDSGTINAADTIKIVNAPELTSVLVTRDGVRLEETGPDPLISLLVTTADAADPRIDIVVAQHEFSISNNPATYAVIAGTPAASPVPPAVPLDAVVLAEVHVAATAGSITNNQIIKSRKVHKSLNTLGVNRLDELEEESHASVATIASLKAIPPEERFDGQTIIVDDALPSGTTSALYRFDASSTATADDPIIVIPNTFALGTAGRWIFQSYFNEGKFIAMLGGTTPSGDFLSLSDALQAFEDSSYREALIIIRDDIVLTGADVTVSKPIKFLGTAKNSTSGFQGPIVNLISQKVTFDVQPSGVGQPLGRVEFENIKLTRDTLADGTDRFIFNAAVNLRFIHCSVSDDSGATATTPVIELTSAGSHILAEKTSFVNNGTAGEALVEMTASGGSMRVILSECKAGSVAASGGTFKTTGAGIAFITMTNYSVFEEDTVPNNTTIDLDGTSLFVGVTQVPVAGAGTLVVRGENYYTLRFEDINFGFSLTLVDVIRFFSGNVLNLSDETFSLGVAQVTLAKSDITIKGTKAGSEGTRIEGSPSAVGNSLLRVTGNRIRLQGIVFRSSPSVASHATAMIKGATSPAEGLEIIDCEFQAEGANDTGSAVALGVTGSVASDRNLIRTCWARSSPDGVAAFFRSSAVLSISGSGLIENCIVENFLIAGLLANSTSSNPINTGGRISKCIVDMSSCTSGAIGISMNGGSLSDCRVRCPTLASSIDTAKAIQVSSTASGEGTVVSNCRISGLGTSGTKRIGIGISVIDFGRNKVSGCSIRDFRKHGIKILGDLNIVVHNVIESVNDGSATPAIEAVTGADSNLVDANLESGTSGYVDGGATNHFDTANTDNTGNKTV